MTRQEVLGVAEARKAVGVLVPLKVYDELRGEREHAVDDAIGSLRAEGLEPSPVAAELSGLFAQGRITAGQMEAMLLAYHRAA